MLAKPGRELWNAGRVVSTLSYLGYESSASGKVTVSGARTSWVNNTDKINIGWMGKGEVDVSNGGTVFSHKVLLGSEVDSFGKITVTGPSSKWIGSNTDWNDLSGFDFTVGLRGRGELVIADGGVVSFTGPAYRIFGMAGVGWYEGSSGEVTVTGPGSQWNNKYTKMFVGYKGNGQLTISDGGYVTSPAGSIGSYAGSPSTATITGPGSHWEIIKTDGGYWHPASLMLGEYGGTGHLAVLDGGKVTTEVVRFYGNSSTGIVDGAESRLNTIYATVGVDGDASLTVSGGGSFLVDRSSSLPHDGKLYMGTEATGSGTILVTGSGSNMTLEGGFWIGDKGTGILEVSNGGYLSTKKRMTSWASMLAREVGSVGRITITGSGSQWIEEGDDMWIGYQGTGILEISNGAVASGFRYVPIGVLKTSDGTLLVTDSGSRFAAKTIDVSRSGAAQLIISNDGTVEASEHIYLNRHAEGPGSGEIVIGSPEGQAATRPGYLSTPVITLGKDSNRILFNHTETDYVFDSNINGGADSETGSGTGLIGPGSLEAVSGRTILNSKHGDFSGLLEMSGTGILQVNGDISGATASVLAGGTLEGNGFVGATYNAGTIAPGADGIGTLTIAGNYVGDGGTLVLETVLGDDNSRTDRLVITGDASGETTVRVINRDGLGARTTNGIQVVRIDGISPGDAFALAGDYTTEDGQSAVIGGAFAYTLHHRNTGDTVGGEWYLMSDGPDDPPPVDPVDPPPVDPPPVDPPPVDPPPVDPPPVDPDPVDPTDPVDPVDPPPVTPQPEEVQRPQIPRYSPTVAVYEQYPHVLQSMISTPTLMQRVGNRYWQQGNGGMGPAIENNGMWGRIEAGRMSAEAARSTVGSARRIDQWKLQTGLDAPLYEGADGSMLVSGMHVIYATADTRIKSPTGRGKISTTGYGIGTTLTWYGSNGFYADAQAQHMWFDSDLSSTTTGRKLVSDNRGTGYALSLETGWRYLATDRFSLTPQVQLVYSDVNFDSFTDVYQSRIRLHDSDSLRARVGLAVEYETSWKAGDGTQSRAQLYGIANFHYEFLNGSHISVSSVGFRSRDERLWAEIGIGGTYNWRGDAHSLYANANISSSTSNFGNDYSFNGMLGYRMKW